MAGDTMKGSYVRGASIWDSANRFITVHSTQHITLSDNVGFGAIGHGFFMETGDEVHVTWERNLGIGVIVRFPVAQGEEIIPLVVEDSEAAAAARAARLGGPFFIL